MMRKLVIIKMCDNGTVQQRVVHYCTSRIEFVMMLAEEEIFKLRFRNIGFFKISFRFNKQEIRQTYENDVSFTQMLLHLETCCFLE